MNSKSNKSISKRILKRKSRLDLLFRSRKRKHYGKKKPELHKKNLMHSLKSLSLLQKRVMRKVTF